MKKQILGVSDPSAGFQSVWDELGQRQPGWTLRLVTPGDPTWSALEEQSWDVVIVDEPLRGQQAVSVLEQAMRKNPQGHRILLIDLGAPDALFRRIGGVHQLLVKPCEPGRLDAVLRRVFTLHVWFSNQTVWPLLGRVPRLPSPGRTYDQVVSELKKPEPDLALVGRWMGEDPPMCAKLLQLTNSAAYGPPLDEANVHQAVEALGPVNIRSMLLLAHSYSDLSELRRYRFSADEFWRHANRTAHLVSLICEAERVEPGMLANAVTAARLHDLGKLALAANLPEQYRKAKRVASDRGIPDWEAEQEVFGTSHDEVAACLLAIWGLPLPVVEAVAMHHRPTCLLSRSVSPLAMVHVANVFARADSLAAAMKQLDSDFLKELGLEERLADWWRSCTDDAAGSSEEETPS